MNDEQYREHCLGLLDEFAALLEREAARCSEDDPMHDLARGFRRMAGGEGLFEDGPALVARLFGSCPHLAPAFPRELLWYLGSDCLHFLADEEITAFQQLDEMRTESSARGEVLNYREARAKLLKLQ